MGEDRIDDEAGPDDARPAGQIPRRSVLRFGTAAAAGAGAAALIPAALPLGAERAGADPLDPIAAPNVSVWPASSMNEAFGGVLVRPRSLERWLFSTDRVRHVVCIGDSITSGTVGSYNYAHNGRGSWTERLATAMQAISPSVGFGFRGLWLGLIPGIDHEWHSVGAWTRTTAGDAYDVCPFSHGWRSNGGAGATLTWTRPANITVAGFDLYWFNMPGAGNWQYRVDNGAWVNMNQTRTPTDNKLHKFYVSRAVQTSVQIRAYNGTAACIAPIGGIGIYSADPNTARGMVVHNLGAGGERLSNLVRTSSGDPLAWFDAVVANPDSLSFHPNLVIAMFSNDVEENNVTQWTNHLVKFVSRVTKYADVLLMNPFDQANRVHTTQVAYRAATTAVVTARRLALLDLYSAFASAGATGWTATNNAGLMFDAFHPSQLGHNDISARVWRLLRTFS